MNCIKKFSRIVCVSLFSYQGCLSYDSLFILTQLFSFVNNFFNFFETFLIRFKKKSRFLRSEIQYIIRVAIRQPLFSIFLIFYEPFMIMS